MGSNRVGGKPSILLIPLGEEATLRGAPLTNLSSTEAQRLFVFGIICQGDFDSDLATCPRIILSRPQPSSLLSDSSQIVCFNKGVPLGDLMCLQIALLLCEGFLLLNLTAPQQNSVPLLAHRLRLLFVSRDHSSVKTDTARDNLATTILY